MPSNIALGGRIHTSASSAGPTPRQAFRASEPNLLAVNRSSSMPTNAGATRTIPSSRIRPRITTWAATMVPMHRATNSRELRARITRSTCSAQSSIDAEDGNAGDRPWPGRSMPTCTNSGNSAHTGGQIRESMV